MNIIVTGASAGMGKATAMLLVQKGHFVVMMARNEKRGQQALKDIKKQHPTSQIALMICDLACLSSIRNFVQEYKEKYKKLDVLINNAGVITPKREQTQDGFELQLGVNHLGHFLLTRLLLDYMPKGGRIINVSSGAHKAGKIHFSDLHLEKRYSLIKSYGQSKLANILFTYELARRCPHLIVHCLHPGAVATQMGIDRETGFGKNVVALLRPFFKTPEKGAQTALYLALSQEAGQMTGKYFIDRKVKTSSKRSYDETVAKDLWEVSSQMVGIAVE